VGFLYWEEKDVCASVVSGDGSQPLFASSILEGWGIKILMQNWDAPPQRANHKKFHERNLLLYGISRHIPPIVEL
jgi:hypothetical protein